jgi:hypothetical protein
MAKPNASLIEGFIPQAGHNQLAEIRQLGSEAAEILRGINELEEVLAVMKRDLNGLLADRIPAAMAAIGMESFKLEDGTKIDVKEFMNGSLPKEPDRRAKALEWVTSVGGEDLIKHSFAIALGKGDTKSAEKVKAALTKLKVGFDEKEDIHPQTFQAFIRGLLKDGVNVPLEDLNLFIGKAAKVTLPSSPAVKPAKEKASALA